MARILVTGGCGFIGAHTCRALAERGDYVVNYDIIPPVAEKKFVLDPLKDKVHYEQGSVEELSTLLMLIRKHDISKIVHIAAVVNPPYLSQHQTVAYRVNLGGTINVLEAMRLADLDRLVYISSIGVFTSKQYEPIDENHPVLLSNEGSGGGAYGAAKIGSEAFCWSYNVAYGIDFVTLRPSAVYGLGMRYPIYIKPIVENSVRGEPVKFEHGRDLPRDYTYVKDVAQGVQRALDISSSGLKDRVFMIATGARLVTPGELSIIVKEFVPSAQIEVGPGLEEWDKREILYRGRVSIKKAREQLGYEPEYYIKNGIKDYITMYREFLAKQSK